MNSLTRHRAGILRTAVLFICCLAISYSSGAFTSETRGENPDEPAHIVTGLMVHDYLTTGLGMPPMAFARNYYLHYPKVTIGHFPPLFYLEQALWTLVFPGTRPSLLCLLALLAASIAARTYSILEPLHGRVAAWCAALLLLTLPATAADSTQIMTEIPNAFMILGAMISFGKYLDSADWKHAAAFGLWSAASLLMKGSGIVLVPIPILGVLLTERWELLRRPSFWMSAPLVLAIAGPWYALAPSAQHGKVAWLGGFGLARWRLGFPPRIWKPEFGWAIATLALVGLLWVLSRRLRRERLPGVVIAAASLAICGTLFPFFVYVWETRHQGEVTAAFVVMAATGAAWLVSLARVSNRIKGVAVCLFTVLLASWNLAHLYKQTSFGYRDLSQSIVSGQAGAARVLFISANGNGEGALVSEIAQREPHPSRYVMRATQILASITWMGQEATPVVHTPEEVYARLRVLPLEILVLDRINPPPYSYGKLLEQAILAHPDEWQPWESSPDTARFRIFLRRGAEPLSSEQLRTRMAEVSHAPI